MEEAATKTFPRYVRSLEASFGTAALEISIRTTMTFLRRVLDSVSNRGIRRDKINYL